MQKLIISVGINGGELTRAQSPHLPISPDEIVESVYGAYEAGASIAHVHARDEDGRPAHDLDLYRKIVEDVRARCGIIINLTTDARREGGFATLDLKPEIASFPGGTLNYGDGVLTATMPTLRSLAVAMRDAGSKPELEIFHDGMIGQCLTLIDEGLLDEPCFFQFILGMQHGSDADPRTLIHHVDSIPKGSPWLVCGVGNASVPMAALGIMLGGHVRVGLEDQIDYLPGELATSNAQLVARVVRLAAEFGREVASPGEAREILGIRRTEGAAAGSGETGGSG
jgi:3-keto-5-aminohexanoate cleavage enzyme